jgi:hypothetical protein
MGLHKKNKGRYNKGGKAKMRLWIEFPKAIKFYDPFSPDKKPLLEKGDDGVEKQAELDFKQFMDALMSNPLWNEGYAQAAAQESIMTDFEAAWGKEKGFWVSDGDFKFLEPCAKNPRQIVIKDGRVLEVRGFGRHPMMARQYVSMQESIIRAKTESEKKTDEEAKKKALPAAEGA